MPDGSTPPTDGILNSRGEVAEPGLRRTPGERVDSKGSRGFESPPLRHRVPVLANSLLESLNSPPQRPHLQICGSGETHFPAGDAQFAAKISVGKFGATVWANAERSWDGTRIAEVSRLRGLADSDRSFLLAPKERKFDPFGQSLRGKLRRLADPRRWPRQSWEPGTPTESGAGRSSGEPLRAWRSRQPIPLDR